MAEPQFQNRPNTNTPGYPMVGLNPECCSFNPGNIEVRPNESMNVNDGPSNNSSGMGSHPNGNAQRRGVNQENGHTTRNGQVFEHGSAVSQRCQLHSNDNRAMGSERMKMNEMSVPNVHSTPNQVCPCHSKRPSREEPISHLGALRQECPCQSKRPSREEPAMHLGIPRQDIQSMNQPELPSTETRHIPTCSYFQHFFGKKNRKRMKGLFFCHPCNMSFSPQSAFLNHLETDSHKTNQQLLEELGQSKTKDPAQTSQTKEPAQTSQTKEPAQTSQTKRNVPNNSSKNVRNEKTSFYCYDCKSAFTGNVIEHRRTSEHKSKKTLSRPYCVNCNKFFRTPAKFVQHCKMPQHARQRELNNVTSDNTNDARGGDQVNDTNSAMEISVVGGMVGSEATSRPVATAVESTVAARKELESGIRIKIEDDTTEPVIILEKLRPSYVNLPSGLLQNMKRDPVIVNETTSATHTNVSSPMTNASHPVENKAVGLSFIVPVTGFYCKLCKDLLQDDEAAILHCRSDGHHVNFMNL